MEHIFKNDSWYFCRYDGRRKKFFLNKSKEEFESDKDKHFERVKASWSRNKQTRLEKVKNDLKIFSKIPYSYQGDGLSDWERYQRPSSNGIGWVAICPGERGNNYYVDDPITVAILKRKYQNYFNSKR